MPTILSLLGLSLVAQVMPGSSSATSWDMISGWGQVGVTIAGLGYIARFLAKQNSEQRTFEVESLKASRLAERELLQFMIKAMSDAMTELRSITTQVREVSQAHATTSTALREAATMNAQALPIAKEVVNDARNLVREIKESREVAGQGDGN